MLGEERVSELEGKLSEILEERVGEGDVGPFGNEASKAHMSSLVSDVILSLLESYNPSGVGIILSKVRYTRDRDEFEVFLDNMKVAGTEDLRPHLFRLWMCLHDADTKSAQVTKLVSYDARVNRSAFNQKLREMIQYVMESYCTESGYLERSAEVDNSWRRAVQSSAVQQEIENNLAARELYTTDLFNQIELANGDAFELFGDGIAGVLQTLSIEGIHNSILIHYSREVPGPRTRRTTLFQLIEATMPIGVQNLFREIENRQFQLYISNPNAPETQYIKQSFDDLFGSFVGWHLCRRNFELAGIASEEVDPRDIRINGDTLGFVLDKLYTTHPPTFQRLHAYIKAKGWKADLVDNIATAIMQNRFQFARSLIEISNHLDRPLFDGNCLVHLAAMKGYVGVITKLHEHGANVGIQRPRDGKTGFHLAVEVTQGIQALDDVRVIQTVELLFRLHADINAVDASGSTPLHSAIAQVGRINSTLKLIAMGANVNLLNGANETPVTLLLGLKTYFSMRIYSALARANAAHLVFPQEDGVEVNSVMIAILSRFQVTAKLEALTPMLLASKAAVNRVIDASEGTFLNWLLDVTTDEHVESDIASLKFLALRGLDLNRKNMLGYSALDQVVIDSKHPRFFVYLVESGVKLSDVARNFIKAQITGPKRLYMEALDVRLQCALTQEERTNIVDFKREIEGPVTVRSLKRSGADFDAEGRVRNEIKRSR